MYMKYLLLLLVILSPGVTLAATNSTDSLQGLIMGVGGFINGILIPLVLAIAFLVFMVNVVRFFIIESSSEEGQANAKSLAIYSVSAFVFILSFWGIVNLIADGIGLNNGRCVNGSSIKSDYIPTLAPCDAPPETPATPLNTDTINTTVLSPSAAAPGTSFDANGNPIVGPQ
jgi:hypothetical protein